MPLQHMQQLHTMQHDERGSSSNSMECATSSGCFSTPLQHTQQLVARGMMSAAAAATAWSVRQQMQVRDANEDAQMRSSRLSRNEQVLQSRLSSSSSDNVSVDRPALQVRSELL
jgi:hypothetical protein